MARARVVAGSHDHNGTLRDAPAVMEGTSTPVDRRPGTRHAKHEPRSGGRCGARYRDVAREALRALGSAVLPELRDGGPHAVGDLPLFPQRGDERLRLLGVELERSGLLRHLVQQRLLAVKRFEAGLDVGQQRLHATEPLFGLLHLPLSMVQAVGGVVHVGHEAQHVLEHGARLGHLFLRGGDGAHVVHRALGHLEQTMHVRLERVDGRLPLRHLLERAREVRFDRLPLGEPLLELGHPLLGEAQVPGAAVELVERRRELDQASVGGRQRPGQLPGTVLQLLRGAAACSRTCDAWPRCSVALSSAACLSSSSWPRARVRSARLSRFCARASRDDTAASTSTTRRSARSTVATAAGTSFSILAASSACAFSVWNRSSAPSIRASNPRVRSSSWPPSTAVSERRLLRSSTSWRRASICAMDCDSRSASARTSTTVGFISSTAASSARSAFIDSVALASHAFVPAWPSRTRAISLSATCTCSMAPLTASCVPLRLATSCNTAVTVGCAFSSRATRCVMSSTVSPSRPAFASTACIRSACVSSCATCSAMPPSCVTRPSARERTSVMARLDSSSDRKRASMSVSPPRRSRIRWPTASSPWFSSSKRLTVRCTSSRSAARRPRSSSSARFASSWRGLISSVRSRTCPWRALGSFAFASRSPRPLALSSCLRILASTSRMRSWRWATWPVARSTTSRCCSIAATFWVTASASALRGPSWRFVCIALVARSEERS